MILSLLIFFGVFILLSYGVWLMFEKDLLELSIILGFTLSLLITCILMFIVASCVPLSKCHKTTRTECLIYSMTDNTQIHGVFTLGCGSVEERSYYTYLYKTVNGGLRFDKTPCDDIEIQFTTGTPRIIAEEFVPNDFICFWIFPGAVKVNRLMLIPKKSVVKQINIDLN